MLCLLWFQARNIALCLEFRDSDEEDALPLKVMSQTNTQSSAWSDFTTELHLFYKMTATIHMLPYDRFNIQYILPLKSSVRFFIEINAFIQQRIIKSNKSDCKDVYIFRKQKHLKYFFMNFLFIKEYILSFLPNFPKNIKQHSYFLHL